MHVQCSLNFSLNSVIRIFVHSFIIFSCVFVFYCWNFLLTATLTLVLLLLLATHKFTHLLTPTHSYTYSLTHAFTCIHTHVQYMFGLGTDTPLERPEDTYWRMMPAVCQLQQSLTCLPFAKNPDQALQVILDQRRHISITGVTATSAMSGASHEKYNTKTLRILQHDLRKHDITRLPAIMPCSHSHFVAYGACYYSYMFAKMYAAQIWETKFKRNPLCRKSGEELLTIMLQYGASKDPQSILDVIAGGSLDPTYFIKSLIK